MASKVFVRLNIPRFGAVDLTPQEGAVVERLHQEERAWVGAEELQGACGSPNRNSLDVLLTGLRRKAPGLIVNRRGFGWSLNPDNRYWVHCHHPRTLTWQPSGRKRG